MDQNKAACTEQPVSSTIQIQISCRCADMDLVVNTAHVVCIVTKCTLCRGAQPCIASTIHTPNMAQPERIGVPTVSWF